MKKSYLVAAMLLSCTSAFAADLAKAPPAAQPYVGDMFSGFYAGPHIGYGWNTGNINVADTLDFKAAPQGVVGGLHAGWGQLYNGLYYGLEGDLDAAGLTGTANLSGIPFKGETTWMASLRARLGILVAPHALLYATGGWAWGSGKIDVATPVGVAASPTLDGGVLGIGLEVPITNKWLARVEGLHYFFNDISVTTPVPLVASQNITVARGGLSYRF